MRLFLSYADEDSDIARDIAERLRSKHVSVYAHRDSARPCSARTTDPECAIQEADAFLALLSPDSLTSAPCRRERELALRRDQRTAVGHAGTDFVHVLQVRDTPYHQAGSLRSQPWFDLTSRAARKRIINDLADTFASGGVPAPSGGHMAGGGNGGPPPPPPNFRNREAELDEIYKGVTSQDGRRFWLLVASPQLGKTWLLRQIADIVQRKWQGRWVVRWVDAHELPSETAGDADAILMMMLGQWRPDRAGIADVDDIVADIIRNSGYHLCLLDSAELLDESTIYRLRQRLGEINEDIDARGAGARVALIAASRRDRGWTGLDPARLPQIWRLSEFSLGVVQEALEKLARSTGHRITSELHQHAERVHQLSEGLPRLLTGCLDWTRVHWRELDRLTDQNTFHEIARPYVEDVLLSRGSLRGSGPMWTDDQQEAMRQALRVLSPFRLFTGSHLSDLADRGELRDALTRVEWSSHDLWSAVSGADLVYPSEKGAWLTIDPPIRRLLFRYWYASEAERGQANREACDFLKPFALEQSGRDAAEMLVECLWHEAQALILTDRSAELEASLTRLATELSARLIPNRSFDVAALRRYAVECMKNRDPEFWEGLRGFQGLRDRLADAVLHPTQEYP